MTSSIFLKKSTVSGTIPTVSELVSSELAINLGDGRLYYKNVTSSLVEPINAGTASFLLGFVESASFAETASFALNAGGGGGGAFGGDFSGTFSGSHTGTFIGSFTGSLEATGTLTGTLIGSASFAENAMTAVLAVSAVTATTSSNANTSSFADPLLFTGFRPIKTVIADYNVLFGDYILLVDASSGIIDIVLPDTAMFMKGPASKEVTITKADTGVNTVQIMGSGSQTIIGDATSTLSDQYQGLTLLPSGNIWWVK